MEVRLFVDDDADGTRLTSLGRWLADDPAAAPLVVALDQSAPVDRIVAEVDDDAGIALLVAACLAWRDSRPDRPRARVEHDGAVVRPVSEG